MKKRGREEMNPHFFTAPFLCVNNTCLYLQVRLQACCFSHFLSNHLLMQLAITPAILGYKKR